MSNQGAQGIILDSHPAMEPELNTRNEKKKNVLSNTNWDSLRDGNGRMLQAAPVSSEELYGNSPAPHPSGTNGGLYSCPCSVALPFMYWGYFLVSILRLESTAYTVQRTGGGEGDHRSGDLTETKRLEVVPEETGNGARRDEYVIPLSSQLTLPEASSQSREI